MQTQPSNWSNLKPLPLNNFENLIILYATFYYRWSTPGQVKERKFLNNEFVYDEKKIIEEQVAKLKKSIEEYRGYCSVCNKQIKTILVGKEGFLDKGRTGRNADRESIQSLIEQGKRGAFQAVFTPYSSRVGRRRSVTSTIRDELKDVGIQIYSLHQPIPLKCPTCYDPYDDDSSVITETISDMQAELEISQIRRNYRIGMPTRVKSGKPPGSLPYGLIKKYRTVGTDTRGNDIQEQIYVWDEKKVAIVQRIATEYLEGLGTWKISQRLNLEDIPSPQERKWGRGGILHILKNPAYAGKIRFGWKTSKMGKRTVQPRDNWMIEDAVFNEIWNYDYYLKIQDEIKRRVTIGGRAVASDALLVGLLKCMLCHYSMYQANSSKLLKNGDAYKWSGYACGTFLHRGACQHNAIKQEKLDSLVLREVVKLANDETRKSFLRKMGQSRMSDFESSLKQKKLAFKNATIAYDRAVIAYQKGIDSIEDYAKNKKDLSPIINTLNHEIQNLESKTKNNSSLLWEKPYEIALKRFLECPTPKDKRKVKSILNQLIEKVEFKKDPRNIKIYYRI